jgi:ankyrin repeat protein
MAIRRSDQQDGRQGNDYQNVTVGEGGRSILGNVYADTFSMSILDPRRPEKTEQDKKDEFLESLRFDVMDSRLATIGIAHRDTCSWLYTRAEYLRWQDPEFRAEHHGFLWIKGKPGAGKSTLMKHALQNTQNLGQPEITIVSFFFNARGHELEKTTEGMYRSLLHQVYKAFPDRLPKVLPDVSSESKSHIWQLPVLQDMLREAFLNFGNTAQFTCYIDALDECNEDAIRLAIEYFADLGERAVSQKTKISLCLASRHYPNITMRCYQALNLDEQKDHHEDIQKFVTGKLRGTGRTHSELSEEISARSSGVFLWAALVVQILNKKMDHGATRSQLMANLSAVPAGIEDLLKSILMDGSVFLLPTLLWVLFTITPLTVSELYLAAKIGAGCSTVEDLDQTGTTQKQMQLFILNSSKGLVEFSEGKFPIAQFIHESVREYLLNGGLSVLDDSLAGNLEAKSHSRLAAWCQTAIERNPHRGLRDSEVGEEDLLGYALFSLYKHCEEAFKGGALQLNFLDAMPQSTLSRVGAYTCSHDKLSLLSLLLDGEQVCTHLANGLLRRQLQHYSQVNAYATVRNDAIEGTIPYLDVNARDGVDDRTPLISALYLGSSETVQLLLDCGADPNLECLYDRTPLISALYLGSSETVQLLLDCGADPNLECLYDAPLFLALETEQFDCVELLLNRGANPNAIVPMNPGRTRTPLETALRRGVESTRGVKLLLDRGADPNLGSSGGTPLLAALNREDCNSEDCNSVELLLRCGANPNFVHTHNGVTQFPLGVATRQRSTRLVKSLLEHGADANGNSAKFGEPLADAVSSDLQEIFRLLLAHGADPNGSISHRPLHLAIGRRDELMVRLLLESGADTKAKDARGRDLLQMWCLGGTLPLSDGLCEPSSIAKVLIGASAEVGVTDMMRTTASILAAGAGSPRLVQLLIVGGAEIDAANSTGETALMVAAMSGVLDVVQVLLDAGADINATDVTRRTALVMAAEAGNFEIVRLLVGRGANLDLYGNEAFARYLRQKIVDNAALSAAV